MPLKCKKAKKEIKNCTCFLTKPSEVWKNTGLTVLCCVSELKEAAERAQAQYRSEKQRRKEMELRVNNMEEELQDLKSDKEGLERVSTLHVFVPLSVKEDMTLTVYRTSALNTIVHKSHHGN